MEPNLITRLAMRAEAAEKESRFGDQGDFEAAAAEIERLRAALKPFAELAATIERDNPGWYHRHFNFTDPKLPMTWLIDARAALGCEQKGERKTDV